MNRKYLDDFFLPFLKIRYERKTKKKKKMMMKRKRKRKDDVEDVPSFVNYSWCISLVDRVEKSLHMSLSAIRYSFIIIILVACIRDTNNDDNGKIMASWANKLFIYLSLCIVK